MDKIKRKPSLGTNRLMAAEFARLEYNATPEPGVTMEDLMDPAYWAHVSAKFRAGTIINVIPEDFSFFAEFLVIRAERNWAKVALLRKVEFTKEEKAMAEDSVDAGEFEVKWGGPKGGFRVIRKSDNELMVGNLDSKKAGLDWIRDYDKALQA